MDERSLDLPEGLATTDHADQQIIGILPLFLASLPPSTSEEKNAEDSTPRRPAPPEEEHHPEEEETRTPPPAIDIIAESNPFSITFPPDSPGDGFEEEVVEGSGEPQRRVMMEHEQNFDPPSIEEAPAAVEEEQRAKDHAPLASERTEDSEPKSSFELLFKRKDEEEQGGARTSSGEEEEETLMLSCGAATSFLSSTPARLQAEGAGVLQQEQQAEEGERMVMESPQEPPIAAASPPPPPPPVLTAKNDEQSFSSSASTSTPPSPPSFSPSPIVSPPPTDAFISGPSSPLTPLQQSRSNFAQMGAILKGRVQRLLAAAAASSSSSTSIAAFSSFSQHPLLRRMLPPVRGGLAAAEESATSDEEDDSSYSVLLASHNRLQSSYRNLTLTVIPQLSRRLSDAEGGHAAAVSAAKDCADANRRIEEQLRAAEASGAQARADWDGGRIALAQCKSRVAELEGKLEDLHDRVSELFGEDGGSAVGGSGLGIFDLGRRIEELEKRAKREGDRGDNAVIERRGLELTARDMIAAKDEAEARLKVSRSAATVLENEVRLLRMDLEEKDRRIEAAEERERRYRNASFPTPTILGGGSATASRVIQRDDDHEDGDNDGVERSQRQEEKERSEGASWSSVGGGEEKRRKGTHGGGCTDASSKRPATSSLSSLSSSSSSSSSTSTVATTTAVPVEDGAAASHGAPPRTAHDRKRSRPLPAALVAVGGGGDEEEEVAIAEQSCSRAAAPVPTAASSSSSCGICGAKAFGIMLGCKGPLGLLSYPPCGAVVHLSCNVAASGGRSSSYHCTRCENQKKETSGSYS